MQKVKISEVSGAALDYLVAKIEWVPFTFNGCTPQEVVEDARYSTSWAQGGPIIERQSIDIRNLCPGTWRAEGFGNWYNGQTALIAAMRYYVASKLGDQAEVPGELL